MMMGFLIFGYILLPFFQTIRQAFRAENGYGFSTLIDLLSNPNHRQVIRNTILLGSTTVLTCGVMGIFLATYVTFMDPKRKKMLHILLLSPMMIPGVIIVLSFIQLYGESGMITRAVQALFRLSGVPWQFQGFGPIVFVITYTQYVYFYLNAYVALKYVDYSAIEAARSMGASWLRIYADVIWPVITPAVLTSVIVTFASGVSAFSAPNLMGGGFKVLSTQIVRSKANNHLETASAQVLILFFISAAVMLLVQMYSSRYPEMTSDRNTPVISQKWNHKNPNRKNLKRKILLWIFRVLMLCQILLILLPVMSIVYLSFIKTSSIMKDIFPSRFTLENYLTIFRKSRVLEPLLNSITMSWMAVMIGLLLTVPSAYLTVKYKSRMSFLLRLFLMLPSAMPASVIALNLINAFNRKSIFAGNQALVGGFYIIPIAYTITALPMLMASNEAAVRGIHNNLEEASRSLGAGIAATFLRIILPNTAPGIAAGGILILIRTIGEYTMSALLYGVHNRPISIAIVTNMQEYEVGISLAYGVLVILICYFSLAVIFRLDKGRFL